MNHKWINNECLYHTVVSFWGAALKSLTEPGSDQWRGPTDENPKNGNDQKTASPGTSPAIH